ncbi:MAG: hypothetical protein P8Z76_02035 [Alphaproteobacteria bacterium]
MTQLHGAALAAEPLRRTADLEPGEHLLLWGFRHWVCGLADDAPAHWRMVEREFTDRFGVDHGRRSLVGLVRMIALMQGHAARSIVYHRPCCPCVGEDEAIILGFVAACQLGDWPGARVRAASLVEEAGVGDLLQAGARLAKLMGDRGAALPLRATPIMEGPQLTVH